MASVAHNQLHSRTLDLESRLSNGSLTRCCSSILCRSSKYKKAIPILKVEATLAIEDRMSYSAVATDAAAEALTATRAATQAANIAYPISSLQESHAVFPSEVDLLRLERARLREMEENLFKDWKKWHSGASSWEELYQDHVTLNEPEEVPAIIEEIKKVPITARSKRLGERLARRTRATAKSRQAAAAKAAALATTEAASIPSTSVRSKKAPVRGLSADSVQAFFNLNGSRRSKLLTFTEEVELSRKIQQDLLALEAIRTNIKEQIRREPTIAEWAKASNTGTASFSIRLNDNRRAREKMIRCNLALVVSIAKRYQKKGTSLEDLIQEGSIGLVRGCEKFDPNKGFKFSTYAYWWIQRFVLKAVHSQSRAGCYSEYVHRLSLRIRNTKRLLFHKHGQPPRDSDVARFVGMSVEKMRTFASSTSLLKSLEMPISVRSSTTFGEVIADMKLEDPEMKVAHQLLKADLDEVLMTLTRSQKDVVTLRYGLKDGQARTQQEVGNLLSVSKERVRQIESVAMEKLREPDRNGILRGYVDGG